MVAMFPICDFEEWAGVVSYEELEADVDGSTWLSAGEQDLAIFTTQKRLNARTIYFKQFPRRRIRKLCTRLVYLISNEMHQMLIMHTMK